MTSTASSTTTTPTAINTATTFCGASRRSGTSQLRLTDLVARYGGDEFCIALPACALGDAVTRLEKLAAALPVECSVSAGVATWNGRETQAQLFQRVDRALYDAKRAGAGHVLATGSAH